MARKGALNVGKGWVMVMCRPTLTRRNGDMISTSIAGVNGLCDIALLYTPLHTEELMVLTRAFNQAVWGELPPETAANWLNCCAAAVAVNRSVKETDPYKYEEDIGEKRLEAAAAAETTTIGLRRTEVNTTGNIVNIVSIAPYVSILETRTIEERINIATRLRAEIAIITFIITLKRNLVMDERTVDRRYTDDFGDVVTFRDDWMTASVVSITRARTLVLRVAFGRAPSQLRQNGNFVFVNWAAEAATVIGRWMIGRPIAESRWPRSSAAGLVKLALSLMPMRIITIIGIAIGRYGTTDMISAAMKDADWTMIKEKVIEEGDCTRLKVLRIEVMGAVLTITFLVLLTNVPAVTNGCPRRSTANLMGRAT